jgi:hypothetical protein
MSFHLNRSTTEQILGVLQVVEKNKVHQLFIDFRKAYVSVRREIFYSILIEFWIPMRLVIKMFK